MLGIALVVDDVRKGPKLAFSYPLAASNLAIARLSHAHNTVAVDHAQGSADYFASLFRPKAGMCNQPQQITIESLMFISFPVTLTLEQKSAQQGGFSAPVLSQPSSEYVWGDEFDIDLGPAADAGCSTPVIGGGANALHKNVISCFNVVFIISTASSALPRKAARGGQCELQHQPLLEPLPSAGEAASASVPRAADGDSDALAAALDGMDQTSARDMLVSGLRDCSQRLAASLAYEEERCGYVTRQSAAMLQLASGPTPPPWRAGVVAGSEHIIDSEVHDAPPPVTRLRSSSSARPAAPSVPSSASLAHQVSAGSTSAASTELDRAEPSLLLLEARQALAAAAPAASPTSPRASSSAYLQLSPLVRRCAAASALSEQDAVALLDAYAQLRLSLAWELAFIYHSLRPGLGSICHLRINRLLLLSLSLSPLSPNTTSIPFRTRSEHLVAASASAAAGRALMEGIGGGDDDCPCPDVLAPASAFADAGGWDAAAASFLAATAGATAAALDAADSALVLPAALALASGTGAGGYGGRASEAVGAWLSSAASSRLSRGRAAEQMPIRPYHSLMLLNEAASILARLPADASPQLRALVAVASPLRSFNELQGELGTPSAQLLRLAAHLVHWGLAVIINVVTSHSVYTVSPTANLSPLHPSVRDFSRRFARFGGAAGAGSSAFSLAAVLSLFSRIASADVTAGAAGQLLSTSASGTAAAAALLAQGAPVPAAPDSGNTSSKAAIASARGTPLMGAAAAERLAAAEEAAAEKRRLLRLQQQAAHHAAPPNRDVSSSGDGFSSAAFAPGRGLLAGGAPVSTGTGMPLRVLTAAMPQRRMLQFLEVLAWLLQHGYLRQMHTYVYLVWPWPLRLVTPQRSGGGGGRRARAHNAEGPAVPDPAAAASLLTTAVATSNSGSGTTTERGSVAYGNAVPQQPATAHVDFDAQHQPAVPPQLVDEEAAYLEAQSHGKPAALAALFRRLVEYLRDTMARLGPAIDSPAYATAAEADMGLGWAGNAGSGDKAALDDILESTDGMAPALKLGLRLEEVMWRLHMSRADLLAVLAAFPEVFVASIHE